MVRLQLRLWPPPSGLTAPQTPFFWLAAKPRKAPMTITFGQVLPESSAIAGRRAGYVVDNSAGRAWIQGGGELDRLSLTPPAVPLGDDECLRRHTDRPGMVSALPQTPSLSLASMGRTVCGKYRTPIAPQLPERAQETESTSPPTGRAPAVAADPERAHCDHRRCQRGRAQENHSPQSCCHH